MGFRFKIAGRVGECDGMKWLMLFDENHLQGGFQSRMKQLAAELLARGDSVDFICFRQNPFEQVADECPERCRVHQGRIASTRSVLTVTRASPATS